MSASSLVRAIRPSTAVSSTDFDIFSAPLNRPFAGPGDRLSASICPRKGVDATVNPLLQGEQSFSNSTRTHSTVIRAMQETQEGLWAGNYALAYTK